MGVTRHSSKSESLSDRTRGLLRRYGLRAKKGLGQHFLIDEEVLQLVVAAAELTPSDVVMEIGPGLGVLTRELARQAGWVIAVELDDKLAAILKESLAPAQNVTVINEDVLNIEPAVLFEDSKKQFPAAGYKVVANLPYYIAAPTLRHFLEAAVKPQTIVVMVQKEVAEEITAKPGQMSLLSVSVQLYGQPEIMGYVPAHCFYPEPAVDSAILRITLYPQTAVEIADNEGFFVLVRAGFSAARKQIANSLANGLGITKSEALALLTGANIAPQRRAETLSLEEWAHLWRIFSRVESSSC